MISIKDLDLKMLIGLCITFVVKGSTKGLVTTLIKDMDLEMLIGLRIGVIDEVYVKGPITISCI